MPIVELKSAPPAQPSAPAASSGQPSARERAIARLSGNAQSAPVPNPSQVAPEDVTGVLNSGALPKDSGQNDKSDSSPADAPKEDTKAKAEEPLSSQYAVLARKEKALRVKAQTQEATFRDREAALQAREEALKAKDADYASNYIPKDRLTQDTWNTLTELGISYDQIAQMALNQPQQDPATKAAFQQLQAEIKALKDAQEAGKKSQIDSQQQQYNQALNQIRNEAKQLVESDVSFETIKEMGQVEEVVNLIKQTFDEDGILMTVADAAAAVEEHLVEEAMKLARLKKIQARLAPPAAPKQEQKLQDSPQQPQPTKTLTNAIGNSRPLSAKERAILAFKGELK